MGIIPSDIHRRLPAVRGDKAPAVGSGYGASALARNLHRRPSKSGVAADQKSGSLKPCGSFQADGSDIQPRMGDCIELSVVR